MSTSRRRRGGGARGKNRAPEGSGGNIGFLFTLTISKLLGLRLITYLNSGQTKEWEELSYVVVHYGVHYGVHEDTSVVKKNKKKNASLGFSMHKAPRVLACRIKTSVS